MTLPYSGAISDPGVSSGMHGDLSGGASPGLRVLRRCAAADQLRQLGHRRDRGLTGPRAEADQGVPAAAEPLSVPGAFLPGAAAQREGTRRTARWASPGATSWCRCRRSIRLESLNAATPRALPGRSGRAALAGKPAPKADCSWKTRPPCCRCPSSPSRRGASTPQRPTRSRWSGSTPTTTRSP